MLLRALLRGSGRSVCWGPGCGGPGGRASGLPSGRGVTGVGHDSHGNGLCSLTRTSPSSAVTPPEPLVPEHQVHFLFCFLQ